MKALELRHISKTYGEGAAQVHALRDVSLTVEPGALVAIMGPSGSGKSTMLTIAGSLEDASSGDVLVAGQTLSGLSRNERARLRRRSIGFVFQNFNLLAGLTAAENVALPLELDGIAARAARKAAMAGSRRARPRRSGEQVPRRAVGRRAAAGGHRESGRRRAQATTG